MNAADHPLVRMFAPSCVHFSDEALADYVRSAHVPEVLKVVFRAEVLRRMVDDPWHRPDSC